MAKTKIGGITVEIGADTSDLSKKLKDVNAESKKTTQELKSIDQALKQAPNSLELWKQKQEALSKVVENSKKKLEALVSEQENLKKGLADGTVTEDAYKAYQREIEITKGQIESAEKALDDFTNSNKKAGDSAEKTGKEVADSGKKAEDSSQGYTVLKNAVANLAADGFEKLMKSAKEAWEEIDAGYDTIISKTGATGDALASLQKSADNVFTSMPVEMNDVGAAIGEINTRFKVTDEELEGMTESFLKYSQINNTAVSSSVKNVSGIMKAFQDDTKNTASVLDALTDVGQRTGKDLNSLESELLSNSATFKEMGFDIRQSAELLGQFEENGIEASTALAGLKKAQQNAAAEGKTMTDALSETIDAIKNATDETEALQIASDLFGKKGAAAIAQAIREQRFSIDDLVSGYDGLGDVVANTFEATQDAPDKAKIALNKLKLELAQLAEAVLPKIEKLVDKGVKNLPQIEKTVKNLLPLIKAVGLAYASWKVVSTATDGVKALEKFTKAMQTTGKEAKVLESTLNTGLIACVSLLVSGLVDLGLEMKKAHDEYVPTAERISQRVEKSFEDQKKAIDDVNKSLEDVNSTFKENANEADYEAERTKELWQELQTLADESGNVKDADKKRAEYITSELQEALGLEIGLTGNQITNYQNLAKEIDNVIEKKKASAYIDAYQASAGEMAQNKATTYSEYLSAYAKETSSLEEFNRLSMERYGRQMTPEEFQNLMQSTYKKNDVWNTIDTRMYQLAGEYQTASSNRQEFQAQYNEINDYFNRLDAAQRAYSEGNYKEVENRLYKQKDADREALKSVEKWNDEAEKIYQDNLRKVQAAFTLARETNSKLAQSDINSIIQLFTETAQSGMGAGGKKASEIFTDEFKTDIQKMIDDGFDISELSKWAKDSGVDIAEVFGDKYMNYIQKQLDKGYDVHDLLVWAFNTGGQMSQEQWAQYIEIWKANMRTTFSEGGGIDIAGMVSWAEKTGRTLGDITGENFSEAFSQWTRDLYANNDLINQHSINSQADYEYWKSQGYDFHAAGGFIPYGSAGIVAEAGPELLEVMNGGVRVTNLTPSGMNTAVGGGGDTINNYYYNSVQATIGSRYDVYKMAEDLDTAEKRIKQGRGRQ
jgi:phage-related minor tail protein